MNIQFCDHPSVCHLVYAQLMKSSSYTTLAPPPEQHNTTNKLSGTTHAVNALLRWWCVDVRTSVFSVVFDFSARLGQIGPLETRWRKKGVRRYLLQQRVYSSRDLMGMVRL